MTISDYTVKKTCEQTQSLSDPHHSRQNTVEGRYLGLCSTCGYSDGCTLRNTPEWPVLFCEEFDSSIPGMTSDYPVTFQSMANAPDGYIGLCMNCDNRDECRFRKPEGGIWNCEEYE